jgi:hypothetical protein
MPPLKLDRRLNLVLEVTTDEDKTVWVHHTPIRREVFEMHFLVLTKVMAAMYEQSLPPPMAQRIALLMLRKTAKAMGEQVEQEVEVGLLPEIWRTTNCLVQGAAGAAWTMLPLEKVIADKTISEDDAWEVRNHICFFTAASWVHKRDELVEMIYPLLGTSGSQTTSLTATEWIASLPISTPAENTGATATPSSIPS